jgi:hypothetical protein
VRAEPLRGDQTTTAATPRGEPIIRPGAGRFTSGSELGGAEQVREVLRPLAQRFLSSDGLNISEVLPHAVVVPVVDAREVSKRVLKDRRVPLLK